MKTTSLFVAVSESLKRGEMIDEMPDLLLSQDRGKARRQTEHTYWDFKSVLDISDPRSEGEFAKDVLAFHNAKGGVLIVGVSNDFKAHGVSRDSVCDSNIVRQKLQKYTGGEVGIFTDLIDTMNNKVVWLIFIQPHKSAPIECKGNGFQNKGDKCVPQKGAYYVRVHEESKLCVDPVDFARLFAGINLSSIQAYSIERNEPFFRLFSPHCDEFFGRTAIIDEVRRALNSRAYIVALDGVGGVGKSAIAIEIVRRLYAAKEYQFIISLSAKQKVWTSHVDTRRAEFAGLTTFLIECAKVLNIYRGQTGEDLEQDVVIEMAGNRGLLLIDNLEDIKDSAFFEFLSERLPEPVKALVTTRVDKGLGAKVISVPQMAHDEAIQLLDYELEKHCCFPRVEERPLLESILSTTGFLPLAIKWAASLASQGRTVREIDQMLRGSGTHKTEFLNFCFETMFDELSPIAQRLGTIYPCFETTWNPDLAALALGVSEDEIERAVTELKQRGLLLASQSGSMETLKVLPLTMEFLNNRWHKNKKLAEDVKARLTEAIGTNPHSGMWYELPLEQRLPLIRARAIELLALAPPKTNEARRLILVGLQWDPKSQTLMFLEGKARYMSGDRHVGIAHMRHTILSGEAAALEAQDRAYFATAVFAHGREAEVETAFAQVLYLMRQKERIDDQLLEVFFQTAATNGKIDLLAQSFELIDTEDKAYKLVSILAKQLADTGLSIRIGPAAAKILRQAIKSKVAAPSERDAFRELAKTIEETILRVQRNIT